MDKETEEKFKKHFSEVSFFEKVISIPKDAGIRIIEHALTLYILLREESVPIWVKGTIVAALGYFICPIDVIPDFLPFGFVDDIAVMALVVAELSCYINSNVRKKVEEMMKKVRGRK